MTKLTNPAIRTFLTALLALALAAPCQLALANPTDTGTPMDSSAAGTSDTSQDEGSAPSSKARTTTTSAIPFSFYLTNEGTVTPVKLQNPWGDCWAFAIASAVESSILKKMAAIAEAEALAAAEAAAQASEENSQVEGPDAADQAAQAAQSLQSTPDMSAPMLLNLNADVDISERALAWLAHEVQTAESAGSQSGEGFYLLDPDNFLNQLAEGSFEMIESQLVARQSLISESAAPYQYNNYSGSPQWFDTGTRDGAWDDARTKDWSVEESLRTNTDLGWVVNEIYKLESPAQVDINPLTGAATYVGYDESATFGIKRTLLDIGAVAVAIGTDISVPEEVASGNFDDAQPSEHFAYGTWSQYNASNDLTYNHAVTIVGWDDNYSAGNFAGTSSGQPPANGAWLCKNNWGSDAIYSDAGASNRASHWGLSANSETGFAASTGEDGSEASGFFWLSYYDHTIRGPVAFGVMPVTEDFDNIYQYDYLGAAEFSKPAVYEGEVWVANMFASNQIEILKAVSAQTFQPNDTVNVVVYTIPASLDIEGMSAEELFQKASSVSHQTVTFEDAGVHMVELAKPLLLAEGERFIVAEQVQTTDVTLGGMPYDGSYLNLELSYLSGVEGQEMATASNVVVNPGETFVKIPNESWESSEGFASKYISAQGLTAEEFDIAFGNALVKAYTGDTNMATLKQIYETVALE